jgi:hypothetical protein
MKVWKILMISLLILTTSPLQAKRKSKKRGEPRISFQNSSYDFGKVWRGDRVRQRFTFKNEGNGHLKLKKTEIPCACVVSSMPDEVAPGREGYVELEFVSNNFIGPVERSARFTTNDMARPEVEFTFKAHVIAEFVADPPLVDFGVVRSLQTAKRSFSVKNTTENFEFDVKNLHYDKDIFVVDYRRQSNILVFDVSLKKLPEGAFLREKIIIENNSTHLPKLEVLALAQVPGPITHEPSYLDFGVVKKSSETLRTLSLTSEKPFTAEFLSTELTIHGKLMDKPLSFLETTVKSPQQIELKLRNHSEIMGSVHGRILFTTDHQTQKEVNIDFFAFFE